jgi:hypothetical protein
MGIPKEMVAVLCVYRLRLELEHSNFCQCLSNNLFNSVPFELKAIALQQFRWIYADAWWTDEALVQFEIPPIG